DVNFTPSSGKMTQTVNTTATVTAVSTSVNPTLYGQSTTFTATLTGNIGSTYPTGLAIFKDAGVSIGQGLVSTSIGVTTATFSTAGLLTGNHTITSTYVGDSNFATSTSAALTQTVNKTS